MPAFILVSLLEKVSFPSFANSPPEHCLRCLLSFFSAKKGTIYFFAGSDIWDKKRHDTTALKYFDCPLYSSTTLTTFAIRL